MCGRSARGANGPRTLLVYTHVFIARISPPSLAPLTPAIALGKHTPRPVARTERNFSATKPTKCARETRKYFRHSLRFRFRALATLRGATWERSNMAEPHVRPKAPPGRTRCLATLRRANFPRPECGIMSLRDPPAARARSCPRRDRQFSIYALTWISVVL